MKRKRYSRKFQRMAVERMRSSDNIGDLAKELGVGRRCLYKWQAKLDHLEPGEEAPRTSSHESSYRQQVHRLKRLLADISVATLYRRFERLMDRGHGLKRNQSIQIRFTAAPVQRCTRLIPLNSKAKSNGRTRKFPAWSMAQVTNYRDFASRGGEKPANVFGREFKSSSSANP